MSEKQATEGTAVVSASNIGGIDEANVRFSGGVTALSGRNATNRTSFLQAIMASLGSDAVSLKGDADEGHVTLEIDGATYTRDLRRKNGTVAFSGEPYTDDPESANLFAFLLENNEARQAVARGDDLREIIMRPVDTDAIRGEIRSLETEKREIDQEIERLETRKRELPDLERERTQLENELEEKREELDEKRTELEETDVGVDETREQKSELETAMTDLQNARRTGEDLRRRVETQEASLEALEAELDEKRAELEEFGEGNGGEAELAGEIETLREYKRSLDGTINQLQRVVQFNESAVEGDKPDVADALSEDAGGANGRAAEGDGSVTDRLLEGSTTVCWTCGTEVEVDAIEETLDRLRDLRSEKTAERREVVSELDELEAERKRRVEQREERRSLERRINKLEDERDETESTLESLREQVEEADEEVERLTERVENLESDEYSEILDLHREVNELEFEVERVESELEEVEDRIETIESETGRIDELEAEREDIADDLTELRTRIERLEEEAVAEFNEHMEEILGVLEYENIDRIWIERTEKEVREGRRKVAKEVFDLHIVRRTADGASYEDTVDHLSESEREVTGLVFALAGYLVHDLHERFPFMVLDSLEALDPERIARLVDYFSAFPDYLVAALLPEDAAALDAQYERVTEI